MKKLLLFLLSVLLSSLVAFGIFYLLLGQRFFSSSCFSDIDSLSDFQDTVQRIARTSRTAVVTIILSKDGAVSQGNSFGIIPVPSRTAHRDIGVGSWFFSGKKWLIFTNKHVVEDPNASYTIVCFDGRRLRGKILFLHPFLDIAVIQAIDEKGDIFVPPASLEVAASTAPVGSFVIAIGNTVSSESNMVTFGIISWLDRTIAIEKIQGSSEYIHWLIQTDAAMNRGNSGGPLVDISGRVIGINTAIASDAQGFGFAIPLVAADVDVMMESLRRYGDIRFPFLGLHVELVLHEVLERYSLGEDFGALIVSHEDAPAIMQDSPAAKAWLEPGDIILQADGKAVASDFSLQNALRGKFPGDLWTLIVWKHQSQRKEVVSIVLGEVR